MSKTENPNDLGQVVENFQQLIGEYIALKKRIAKLTIIQYLAKAGGAILESLVSIVLISIVLVLAAITGALWLSSKTGSYISGFGLMTVFVLIVGIIIHLLRKILFVNPIVHRLVRKLHAGSEETSKTDNEKANPY